MMKVQIKVGPKALVEADGETVKQVFERLACLAGVFVHANKCGACGSDQIVPQVRQPQGFTYYEMACIACGCKLTFGQAKEGGALFAKGDWHKFQANSQADDRNIQDKGY